MEKIGNAIKIQEKESKLIAEKEKTKLRVKKALQRKEIRTAVKVQEVDLPPEKIFDAHYEENMKLASRIEKVVFAAHNQMRSDPKSFIPVIENQIKNFESPESAKLVRFGRPDLIT